MNLFVHTISGIETTIQICNYLSQSAHNTVQEYIQENDVMDKLQNTHSILYYIHHQNDNILEDPCHPIIVATHSVIDIVQKIRSDLSNIKTITKEHQTKWFRYLYSPDYVNICKQLETHIRIHDLRIDRLMHIMPILDESFTTHHHSTSEHPTIHNNTSTSSSIRRHSWS